MRFIVIYICINNNFVRNFVTVWAASSLQYVRLFQKRLSQIVELLTHSVSARWVAWTNVVPKFRLLSRLRETSLTCLNLCPIRPGTTVRRRMWWVVGRSTMMLCLSLFLSLPFLFRLIIIFQKSGNFNLLKLAGPVHACNRIALLFTIFHLSFPLSDFVFFSFPVCLLSYLFSLPVV